MGLKLREPEVSPIGTERTGGRRRAGGRNRWEPFWLSFSLLSALIGAGLVLYLAGGLVGEQDVGEIVAGPSMAESSASTETAPSFDADALRDQLEEIAEGHEGVYGVAVLDPTSGTKISLRGDEEFMAASIGKLPTLATLYRAASQGELDLEEEISVLPEDIETYGVDDLQYFPADLYLSLRDLAYRLVNYSDNAAWVTLDRRLGEEKIRSELEGMGIENSRYHGYLSGYYTTPDDVLLLLERISDPQFTNQELSAEMLDAMTETTLEDRIPEKLPRDVRVAHKTGSYDDHFGDAGVVFYKDGQGVERRYYLAVLAKDTNEDGARDAIQSISLAVYEALTGTKVDRGWSRGDQDLRESGVDDQAGWVDNTEEPAHLEGGLDNSWADWTNPAKNAGKNEETVEPARPSGEKASAGRRYNAVPNPSYETAPYLAPDAWETVDPEPLYSAFPEENSYWGETAELW